MKGDDIAERLLSYAVRVIRVATALPRTRIGAHIADQLTRSGTAAGSHYEEARGAESPADFVHKLGISWKELRESIYWLKVIQRAELVKAPLLDNLLIEGQELSAILAQSLKTARKRLRLRQQNRRRLSQPPPA